MKNKAYIINFDIDVKDNFDYSKFHESLTKANGVETWWHYLASSYIIIVKEGIDSSIISEYVRKHMPNKNYFVAQLNLLDHNGWLPKNAWDWINEFNNL
jgi:hypothetical protein